MKVKFEETLVMNVRSGKTKNGSDFSILKFLDAQTGEDYKIWCFGDSVGIANFLKPMGNYVLTFNLFGSDDGGVRLVLEDAQPF